MPTFKSLEEIVDFTPESAPQTRQQRLIAEAEGFIAQIKGGAILDETDTAALYQSLRELKESGFDTEALEQNLRTALAAKSVFSFFK